MTAVQEERSRIRESGILGVIQKLRDTFANKYDYDIFKETETDVSKALNEKPMSILRKLQKNKQHNINSNCQHKPRNNDIER